MAHRTRQLYVDVPGLAEKVDAKLNVVGLISQWCLRYKDPVVGRQWYLLARMDFAIRMGC